MASPISVITKLGKILVKRLPGPNTTMSASSIALTTLRAALGCSSPCVFVTNTWSIVLRSSAIFDSPTATEPSLNTACNVNGRSDDG